MNDTISIGTKVKLGKMVYVVTTVQDDGIWGVREGMSIKPVDEFGSIAGESFLGYPDEVSGFVVGS